MNDDNKIELALFAPGLPLGFADNLMALLALFPLCILLWLLRGFSFVQEGFALLFLIPGMSLWLSARYFLAKKHYSGEEVIVLDETSLCLPGVLQGNNGKNRTICYSDLGKVVVNEIRGKIGKSKWNLILTVSGQKLCLGCFAVDLNKICEVLEGHGVAVTYQIYRPQKVIVYLWLGFALVFTAVYAAMVLTNS